MNERELNNLIKEKEATLSLAFPSLMRKVYVWMTLALVITGVTAYGVAHSTNFIYTLMENRWIMWALIIAELALVFILSARVMRMSLTTATLMFILFSAINGTTLSVIFLAYSTSVIAKVFFITAGTFGATALFGYTTKRDLSSIGRILYMALFGLIIATVVNIFVRSSGFDIILSYLGVAIFIGLTAWDTQKIKIMLAQCDEPNEEAHKIALLGSLSLYLDFVNLFLYMLRIFGGRE